MREKGFFASKGEKRHKQGQTERQIVPTPWRAAQRLNNMTKERKGKKKGFRK